MGSERNIGARYLLVQETGWQLTSRIVVDGVCIKGSAINHGRLMRVNFLQIRNRQGQQSDYK